MIRESETLEIYKIRSKVKEYRAKIKQLDPIKDKHEMIFILGELRHLRSNVVKITKSMLDGIQSRFEE